MAERKAPARKPAKATAPEPTKPAAETPAGQDAPTPEPAAPAPPDHAGLIGAHTDPTPNENYSISGVIAGLPVPGHDR